MSASAPRRRPNTPAPLPPPESPPHREPRSLRFELTTRSVALVFLGLASVWLAFKLWTVLLVIVCALILVGTLNPLVRRLERVGIQRGWAVLIILLGLLVAAGALLFITVPSLVGQVDAMIKDAPRHRDTLVVWLNSHGITRPLAGVLEDAASQDNLSVLGSNVVSYSSRALKTLGYAVSAIAIACYLLADGRRAQSGLYAVVPRRYHVRLARIMVELELIVGGYVRGQLITSAAIGVFVFTLMVALGIPGALPLAVFAALTDVIPFVGGLIATTPVVLAALSRSSTVAVIVLIVMFIYQEFESRILVPRIYGKVLRLSPAAVVVALLVGGTLLGIVGALIALPIAAAMMMIGRELRVELPGDDSDHTAARARDQVAEEAYEALSIGADPETAAVIATDLARETQLPVDVQQ